MKQNNRGIDVRRQKKQPKDWDVSGENGLVYVDHIPSGDWEQYLNPPEPQSGKGSNGVVWDTDSCVIHSYCDIHEAIFNYKRAMGLIPQDLIDWLTTNKYIVNGIYRVSRRALAKMSNTTHQGNWNANVSQTADTLGLVPEALWQLDFTSWNVFYSEVPAVLQALALEFHKRMELPYAWVEAGQPTDESAAKANLSVWMKHAPLQSDIPICPNYDSGNVSACGLRSTQHAIAIYKIVKDTGLYIFDHYNPWKKILAFLYPTDWTMVIDLVPTVVTVPVLPSHKFLVDLNYGLRNNSEVVALQNCLIYLGLLGKGLNTGNYLGQTQSAVKAFLVKYHVTSAWNIYWNAGKYCGILTRQKLNAMFP